MAQRIAVGLALTALVGGTMLMASPKGAMAGVALTFVALGLAVFVAMVFVDRRVKQ